MGSQINKSKENHKSQGSIKGFAKAWPSSLRLLRKTRKNRALRKKRCTVGKIERQEGSQSFGQGTIDTSFRLVDCVKLKIQHAIGFF